MNKDYIPGLRIPNALSGEMILIKEYDEAKDNGICNCKHELPVYLDTYRAYCCRCRKLIS